MLLFTLSLFLMGLGFFGLSGGVRATTSWSITPPPTGLEWMQNNSGVAAAVHLRGSCSDTFLGRRHFARVDLVGGEASLMEHIPADRLASLHAAASTIMLASGWTDNTSGHALASPIDYAGANGFVDPGLIAFSRYDLLPRKMASLAAFVIGVLGLLFSLVIACKSTRFERRMKRGICSCGYDLSGLSVSVCPECGSPIGRDIRVHE